jgi:hypothetical protein
MSKLKTAIAAALFVSSVAPHAFAAAPRSDAFRTATAEERAMTFTPLAPGAAAVVLDWTQREDDVDSNSSEYLRIKILTEEGKKYGDVEITYVPLFTDLRHIEARTTKPDGSVVPFNGKIYEKLIVKRGGIRVIAKTFSLPDVTPGSIIEYRYDLAFRGETLRNTNFIVQRELPVLHETLYLRPYTQLFTSFFTYRGLPDGKKPVKSGDHYDLELENIPAFQKEAYAPPEGELKPAVNFFYTIGQIEPQAFWKKEGNEWRDAIEDFIGRDRASIRKAADEATTGATLAEERLRKLYGRAQQIRNLGYEAQRTEAEERKLRDNHSVDDVLRNGYGYSSQINRFFIALARAGGFEATAARIADRDEFYFAKNLSIASQLNSEVAFVKLDGRELVLDAGTPNAPFGVVAWEKTHVPGLRLAKKQDPIWTETPEPMAADAVIQRRADLRFDGDTLKGKMTVTYNRQEALARRLANYTDDEAATKKSIEETAKKRFPEGSTVTLTKLTGMKSTDDKVVADFDVELPNLGSFAGSRALLPMAVFNAAVKNPFASGTRKYAVAFDYPFIEDDDVTLEIPAGYTVESLPAPKKLDLGAVAYDTHYEAAAGKLHYTRKLTIDALLVPVEKYPAIRAFYSQVAASDQEQVVLKKGAK